MAATPKHDNRGFSLQTPKGNIGGLPNIPTTTTNAGARGLAIDMSQDGANLPPQTPGGKVPSLDMSKVAGAQPASTTNKNSGRLLL